jgi:hypothetical protein
MRKLITQVTVNKINEMIVKDMKYSKELKYFLNEMLSRKGCFGASLKEMKKWDMAMENHAQFDVYDSNIFRGMGITFQEYISPTFCLDLHYVTIKDFNGLVNACYLFKEV